MKQPQRYNLKVTAGGMCLQEHCSGDLVRYEEIQPLLGVEQRLNDVLKKVMPPAATPKGFGGLADLIGRVVQSVEVASDYSSDFQCIVCTDGTRVLLLNGRDVARLSSRPKLEAMKRAPLFFTKEEIAAKERQIAFDKEIRAKDERRRKEQELARLQAELGKD
jgi:hypothetical protein